MLIICQALKYTLREMQECLRLSKNFILWARSPSGVGRQSKTQQVLLRGTNNGLWKHTKENNENKKAKPHFVEMNVQTWL